MQLVATSKLRRAKERMEASKPYGQISGAAMAAAVARCTDPNVPFVTPRSVKRRCYVVIAGERGLAGGYNNNVFKAVAAHTDGTGYCVLPLGRKAVEKYAHLGVELLSDQYARVESISVGSCYAMAKRLIEGYTNEEFDEIWLAYTSFQSMMTQEVQLEQLLPIRKPETSEPLPVSAVYELEPADTLKAVMPDFLAGRLYSALCDSFASEVASRRNAMDSATKNAGEMIDGLRLRFNRARQGSITQEITEIVAGAES